MNPALRHQLRHLDRALLQLIDERAALLCAVEPEDRGRTAAVEDMLRRHTGNLDASAVRDLFAAIDRACAGFHAERSRP